MKKYIFWKQIEKMYNSISIDPKIRGTHCINQIPISDHTYTTAAASHGSDESPLVHFRVKALSWEETLGPSKTTTDINLPNTHKYRFLQYLFSE